jgi:hypothetical protein
MVDDPPKQPYKRKIKKSYYTTQDGKILKIDSIEEKVISGDAEHSETAITKDSEISFPCDCCGSPIHPFDHVCLMKKRFCKDCGKELARNLVLQSIDAPGSVSLDDLLEAEMLLTKKT